MIELRAQGLELAPRRGAPTVLHGIDLVISGAERIAVMGPSGAGKSTLAMALAGLADLRGGSMSVTPGARVAYVLQQPERALFGETVADDVGFALRCAGEHGTRVDAAVVQALTQLGFDPSVAVRDPLSMSGGEQRRVAIAASTVPPPSLLVLDEPSAGLDAGARLALQEALVVLQQAGCALVVITHDAEEAALCRRLIVVGDGRLRYDGPAEPVLGEPRRATELGVPVPPAVRVAHRVAAHSGLDAPRTVDELGLVRFLAAAHGRTA